MVVFGEPLDGKSDIKFTYHIVANRADEDFGSGRIAKYSKCRFPKAMDIYEVTELNLREKEDYRKVDLKGKK